MKRRTLLAVVGSGLLAGCTDAGGGTDTTTGPSTTEPSATPTATPTESGPTYAQTFRSKVESEVSVLSLDGGDPVELAYTSTATTREEVVTEMAYVAGFYADVVDDGWSVSRLNATPTRSDGVVIGTWHVETEWAESFVTGDLSDEAYLRKVLETLTVEASPDGG